MSAQSRHLLQRLSHLGGGPVVLRRAATKLLASLSEPAATELLATAIRLSREGWWPAVRVLPALLQSLDQEPELLPAVDALRRVASLHQLPEAEDVFACGQATRELDLAAAARADQRLVSLPLGVLRSRARLTRNPDELARLAVVSNPAVVREVLKNPRLTEPLVVRVAARRPARPEPLVEIWRSSRWSALPTVRRALAFNPYLPPSVGSKIVPLLARADLEELKVDSALHPALRAQARRLLESAPAPPRSARRPVLSPGAVLEVLGGHVDEVASAGGSLEGVDEPSQRVAQGAHARGAEHDEDHDHEHDDFAKTHERGRV